MSADHGGFAKKSRLVTADSTSGEATLLPNTADLVTADAIPANAAAPCHPATTRDIDRAHGHHTQASIDECSPNRLLFEPVTMSQQALCALADSR
jgi:hypothetical protein